MSFTEPYPSNPDQLNKIMELGEYLNLTIGCPVRYPAFDHNIFECKCGIPFPVFVVEGNRDSPDVLIKIHRDGTR